MCRSTGNLSETDFIAFDLETTGLHAIAAEIVEIGAVRFRGDGTVLDQFEQLVNPECRIPAEATAVHGITNRMVTHQPAIGDVLPEFVEFLGTAPVVLMAHNAGFDVSFLSVALQRLGLPQPTRPVIDTCQLARCRLRLRNYRLETIGRYLQVIQVEEHRALADAVLAKDVFLHLVRRPSALQSVDELLRLTGQLNLDLFAAALEDPPVGYEELWLAISQKQPVAIEYWGGSHPGAVRTITPRAVVQLRGQVYLAAYCHQSDCDKTFRLDRIAAYRRIT